MVEFEHYERLLWRVLSRLAGGGYVLPPGESRDIIHDFYVESWGDLVRRFDAEKGGFSTFLFTAFYRFARRRIIRWQQWHRPLRTLRDQAERIAYSPVPWMEGDHDPRLTAIRAALQHLPAFQREVLQDFLASRSSERELALRHGMTRYRLRETLVDALGQVMTELGERTLPATTEGKVALALWRDGCSVQDTSKLLGLSAAEVQATRWRLVRGILDQLRSLPSLSLNGGTAMNFNPLQLLKNALLSVGQKQAVEEVWRHATQIREALDTADVEFSEEEAEVLANHPEWAAEVYRALAGPEEAAEQENQITEAIRELHARTDEEIAQAFVLALENMPPNLHDWPRLFGKVPEAPRPFQDHLLKQAVVRKAMPYAGGLVRLGMTPAVFVEGARGLELLCNRLIREDYPAKETALSELYSWIHAHKEAGIVPSLALSVAGPPPNIPVVPYPMLVAQMRGTPQCPPEAAEPLLHWLVRAAQLRPFLIRGYQADPLDRGSIHLKQTSVKYKDDLVWRWSRLPREVREKEPELQPV